MREESTFRPMASGLLARGGEMASLGTTRESNRAVRSVALVADSVISLVRRAMNCLESDRDAALRCLHDASTLLGADTHEVHADSPAALNGFHPGGLARWQVRRTVAYVEENLGSKLGIHQLAELVSFSKSHFSRAFKRSLGLTPMEYVAKRRVERAKFMMVSTGEQLTYIAMACGFADQSHLNRSFRRIVGVNPGAWRRANTEVEGAV
jgi:AraC family transcriptional regulator